MSALADSPLSPAAQQRLTAMQAALAPYREVLVTHPVYREIDSLPRLRIFMQHHVLAVWDFMSLLKWLQAELTCVQVPWRPKGDPITRRLINEIVLAEESDIDGADAFASHFEMYLAAMADCQADVAPVLGLVERITAGNPVRTALNADAAIPPAARQFVESTFHLIDSNAPHVVAAAFALGREDLIPDMFRAIVDDLDQALPARLSRFQTYLDRHIELDGDEHTPLALRMLASLCGDDDVRWHEATEGAKASLIARRGLWDGVIASF